MKRGYLALWRKIQEHDFYKEKRVYSKFEAWLDILMEVQHKEEPQEVVIGMKLFTCNYGESLKSLGTWGKRWGWGRERVKRFFDLLEIMKQIRYTNETVTTRITLLNYSKYDPRRNTYETQTERDRAATEPRLAHRQECKERKECKYSVSDETLFSGDSGNDACPHQEIIKIFHSALPQLPKVKMWGGTSKKNLRSRWLEDKSRQNSKWWANFFEYISKSDFLTGRAKEFQATLAWIVGPKNFEKIINGQYENRIVGTGSRLTDQNIRASQEFING